MKYFNLRKIVGLFVIIILCLDCFPVYGKFYIDIDSPYFQKFPIAITDFKNLDYSDDKENLSCLFSDNLTENLKITGFFRVIDKNAFIANKDTGLTAKGTDFSDWKNIGADFLITGGFQANGEDLSAEFRLFDVVEGKLIVGKKYWGKAHDSKIMILKFTSEILNVLTGGKGVFDTKIAFIKKKGEKSEIYTVKFDGSELMKITNSQSLIMSPHWAPEGKRILFTSYIRGNPDVYIMDLRSKKLTRVSKFAGLNLAAPWSPSGSSILLVLSKDGNPEIYVKNLEKNQQKRITYDASIDVSPTWSPEGRHIAFVSNRSGTPQIFIMDSDGKNIHRLTYNGGYNTSPTWSANGRQIAYEGMTAGIFQIFSIGTDGKNCIQLTFDKGGAESPCWSPDGKYLSFIAKENGKSKVCVMNANGSNMRVLYEDHDAGSSLKGVSWSPHLSMY